MTEEEKKEIKEDANNITRKNEFKKYKKKSLSFKEYLHFLNTSQKLFAQKRKKKKIKEYKNIKL